MDFEELMKMYLVDIDQEGYVEFDTYVSGDNKYQVISEEGHINDYISTEDVLLWFHQRLLKLEKQIK